jgi:hypothetical protein
MLITDRPSADVEALRSRLYGAVYGPDDAGWDEVRRAWNLAIDQRPAAVAFPLTDSDVVAVVEFAREEGLRVAAQATGHGAGAIASLEDAILISTKHMRGVRIDPGTRRARVRAGAVWADVTGPAAAYGLAPLAGSAGDVGVVGYTLGGGLSWLGRKHGLACNSVVAIELVTADARPTRVDAARDPELFWALRGGGGQFGVVTAIEFELHPVEELQGGALMWPAERAEEIFAAWRDWTATVPDDVTSLCRIVNAPGGPSFVVVEAAILGDAEVLDPLRALEPDFDMVGPMSPAELIEIHNDPKQPVPGMSGHRLLAGAPDEAIQDLVAHASKALVAVELRHLGGARERTRVCPGALPGLKGEYSLFAVGIVPDAEAAMAVDVALTRLTQALGPWDSGYAFRNFSERRRRFHDGHAVHRLRSLKALVDGDDLFVA